MGSWKGRGTTHRREPKRLQRAGVLSLVEARGSCQLNRAMDEDAINEEAPRMHDFFGGPSSSTKVASPAPFGVWKSLAIGHS